VQQDVRRVAGELLERYPNIHVLVNNAGVVNTSHSLTPDGIETVLAVNHLASYLLSRLLLGRLTPSGRARIVTVASEAHRWGAIDFADLGHARRWRTSRVYGASKLANILFTYELARRLEGTDVTANCLHPGAVATRLGHNNGRWAVVLSGLLRPFFRTPEQGAATAVHLASSPAVEGVSGRYFVNGREARSSAVSYDTALARRLWDVSAELTGLSPSSGPLRRRPPSEPARRLRHRHPLLPGSKPRARTGASVGRSHHARPSCRGWQASAANRHAPSKVSRRSLIRSHLNRFALQKPRVIVGRAGFASRGMTVARV
jgi:NAD(P)-dependent dehydrogenase (short-subunit alcohol dehydrogenase family)